MTAGFDDPVSRYLAVRGLPTHTAYFEDSEFELGRRVEVGDLEVVYRFEDGVLLICQLSALRAPEGMGGAVSTFVGLIREMLRNVPEMDEVRGLVIDDVGSPMQRRVRQKLKQLLLQHGAREVAHGARVWLSFDTH